MVSLDTYPPLWSCKGWMVDDQIAKRVTIEMRTVTCPRRPHSACSRLKMNRFVVIIQVLSNQLGTVRALCSPCLMFHIDGALSGTTQLPTLAEHCASIVDMCLYCARRAVLAGCWSIHIQALDTTFECTSPVVRTAVLERSTLMKQFAVNNRWVDILDKHPRIVFLSFI